MAPKKIIAFAIGPLGSAFLGLLTLPFLAWFFSVQDVGRFTMLQVVLELSVSVFSLQMHQSYVREYHEEEDKAGVFRHAILPGTLLLLVVSGMLFVIPVSLSELAFGIDSMVVTAILIAGVYLAFLINMFSHVVRMQERALAFSFTLISPKAFLLLFIAVALLTNISPRFEVLISAYVASLFVTALLFSWLTKDTWLPALSTDIDKILLTRMLRFGGPLLVGGIAYSGLRAIDRILLRRLSGFEELGVFSMAASLAAGIGLISTVFSTIWHPTVYRWVKDGISPQMVQPVIESMLLLVVWVWSAVGLLSWSVTYFLPSEYGVVRYLLVPCAAMPLLYMLSETTVIGIGITRKSLYSTLATGIALISNVALNYILIPHFGAAGAALATMFSFFVFFVMRTESTVFLWSDLPRKRMYVLLVLYLVASTFVVVEKPQHNAFQLVWIILSVIASLLYMDRFKSMVKFIRQFSTQYS